MVLSKLAVAVQQLDVAIQLFLDGDNLSSLTLSGAAEEILGSLCAEKGLPIAKDFIVDYHLIDTDSAIANAERRRVLSKLLNGPRNAAKHANDSDAQLFEAEQTFPLQMIMRALPMVRLLGTELEHESKMRAWIRAHPEAMQ